MRNSIICLVILALSMASAAVAEDYYTGPQVYGLRPRPDREMELDCVGATGIKARFYRGALLKVEGTIPGSPADGKFKVGQIITGINGTELKGKNGYVVLGKALTRAEATDGKMVFDVKANEGSAPRRVALVIPVLGTYSKTWPLKCEKSKKIIKRAAEFYATDPAFRKQYFNDKSENGGVPSALACLFLLSTGEDKYVPVVKEYFARFPEDVSRIGDHTWNNGYNGIACAEYFLRTGDKSVLPILQYYCDNAKERQYFGCGWGHWGRSINPGYVASGLMNPAGAQVLTTLLLGKECGVDVDEKTLLGALRFWYRFAGHGTVPYGDHRGEGGLGSNGKDGMSAAAMQIASRASGKVTIYEMARDHLSMATLTSYPSLVRGHADEGRGDGIWRGIASAYVLADKPKEYHAAMDRLTWWYDLSRRPSGAIGLAACQRFDDVGSGAGAAMAYTAPLKALAITGAPRSKHAKKFQLPAHLWGRKADLALLSVEHGRSFKKYGKDEPIHVPFYRLGSAYSGASKLAEIPREEILKNVYHKRYMIRAQAAKALRSLGAFDELEKLLGNRDPRVRRAALDGMTDYRYWFHFGRSPMKPEQFTSGMITAIRKMLKDSKEALYVVDGALMALSLAPAAEIGESLSLVMPWTTHEDWWLRQSAFSALNGAARDSKLLPQVLPTMLAMMVAEDHTQPRQGMVHALTKLMRQHKADSSVGQQIVAAHMKAVNQREIIAGPRAGEGVYDVSQSANVILKEAPGAALNIGRAIEKRFSVLGTGHINSFVGSLIANLAKLPEAQKGELTGLLYKEYRQELIRRLKEEANNLGLVNTIMSLTELKHEGGGWKELGSPKPESRTWRFTSFNPQPKDVLHPREKKRFRDVALPAGCEGWYEPDFNDAKWQRGKSPIGVGVFEKNKVSFESRSDWGDGEFLLARTTFKVKDLEYNFYRISVLANQGFHIYVNGHKIHTYIWWKNDPYYRQIMLGPNEITRLKKGTNLLAVYANTEYPKEGPAVGQINVYLEGLKTSDLLGDRK